MPDPYLDKTDNMANVEELQKLGWYLSPEGLEECYEDGNKSKDDIIRVALDSDLKDIGRKLAETTGGNKLKLEQFEGPQILQIQKLRNVSAPKDNEDSQVAPPMYKLILTDGQTTYPAVEKDKIHKLSLETPPGTKVLLRGKVPISSGFLLLNKNNCEILGGRVDKLVENWQLKRTLAHQSRYNVGSEGSGPPPFIPFGQRRMYDAQPPGRRDNFKSLDQGSKEKKIEDTEFEQQRQRTIAAITEVKGEQQGKVYGSGSMVKPSDRDIASIVDMGFTMDQAHAALKQNNNSLAQAVDALINPSDGNQDRWAQRNNNRGNYSGGSYRNQQQNDGSYRHQQQNDGSYRNQPQNDGSYRQQQQNDRTDYNKSERSDYRNERSEDYKNDYRNDRNNDYVNSKTSNGDYSRSERTDDRRNDRQTDRNGRAERNDQTYDRNDRPDRTGRNERPDRGRGRRGREEDEDDEYRKGPSANATLFDFIVSKKPDAVKDSKEDGSKEHHRVRDSSKSSDNSDKRSVSGAGASGGGPPNLPPRLVRQQRRKEEEARARRQGPTPADLQRPPPPPPYAIQAQQNRQKQQSGPRQVYPDQLDTGTPTQHYPPPPNRHSHPAGKRNVYNNNPNMRGGAPLQGNANVRGPVQNKTLWNENEGGGRRHNYNDQRYDNQQQPRNYNRRGPNQGGYQQRSYDQQPRYDNTNSYQNPQQNRQFKENSHQYSSANNRPYMRRPDYQQGGYKRPPNNSTVMTSSDQLAHQQQQEAIDDQQQEVVVVGNTAQDLGSAPRQVSPVEGEVVDGEFMAPPAASEEMVGGVSPGEGEESYVMVGDHGAVVEEYIEGEVMDPNAMVAIDDPSQQAVYIQYAEENGEMSQHAAYMQVQGLVSPLQQMTLSGSSYPYPGAGVSGPYPPGGSIPPGGIPVMMDQSGGVYPGLYSPTEYNGGQSNGGNPVKAKNNMYLDGYPGDGTGKPGRQWKPGDYCMAKYWEDLQFYRAIIQQVEPTGVLCVVQFPDYGNLEQVSVKDIRPVPRAAWDNNTLQMPVPMVIATSQPGMSGPPGILIQNPPPISPFIPAAGGYPDPQYSGAMMTLPPGTMAYAPVVTSLATTTPHQPHYSKQAAVHPVYMTATQPLNTSHIITHQTGAPTVTTQQQVAVATSTSQQPQPITQQAPAGPNTQPAIVTAMPMSQQQPTPSSQVVATAMTSQPVSQQPVVTVITQAPTASQPSTNTA